MMRARDFARGYGEGEEVALAVALAVVLGVALCSAGTVLWRVVAGRVGSLGAAGCSVVSTVLWSPLLRSVGVGAGVSEEW